MNAVAEIPESLPALKREAKERQAAEARRREEEEAARQAKRLDDLLDAIRADLHPDLLPFAELPTETPACGSCRVPIRLPGHRQLAALYESNGFLWQRQRFSITPPDDDDGNGSLWQVWLPDRQTYLGYSGLGNALANAETDDPAETVSDADETPIPF